ncbi:MAG: alanine dehydrogenase [Bacteroidota bacterium]|jgi:alanine dehydrogenase|nr:alanine dehydrogenase [Prolixibacteraceae bacterium]MDI9562764.1 alanine dehydrogenase [Bacteroidota bacterium]HOF54166.1 alanine dehydrogenase [Prolixibacteraceae bacterium]HOR99223.1 alanine dehydrogenase [Prolixibacteraceae bacterium]HOS90063.1 alanine dehydrogenase [Prolixibacteraceae bacterium]
MTTREKTRSGLPVSKTMLLPKEEMLEVQRKEKKIVIGIPSDISKVEYRVPLTPQAVDLLVSYGHEIYIEAGAGRLASYSDQEYTEAGAVMVEKKEELFQCDIILRVAPFNSEEIELLRGNQVIISNLQIQSHCRETIDMLMQKKMTCIAYEYLENENGFMPFVHQMSQISGITSVTVASEYLSNSRGGKGVLFGDVTGITPAELVIIGSGTAAEFAARAALSLGIVVKVFDTSVEDLSRLEEKLGRRIFTSVLYPKVLKKALVSADAVLGAMPFNSTPNFKVSEEIIASMKEGAVIVDLNASQGGVFETSQLTDLNNPVFRKHGVIHYCVPNLPSLVARTASISMSNLLIPELLAIGDNGGVDNYIKSSRGFRKGVYLYHGILTSRDVGNQFNMAVKDIELLLAVF